jgi:hypothetical protein
MSNHQSNSEVNDWAISRDQEPDFFPYLAYLTTPAAKKEMSKPVFRGDTFSKQ